MKKIKEFKEIATNIGIVLKKYWFYKQNLKKYLDTKDFSEEEFQKIIKDLYLNLNLEMFIDEFEDEQSQEKDKTTFIKLLMIESLYNNHELFKKIKEKYNNVDLQKECREVVFKKTLNERVKTINYEDLRKNLDFLKDTKLNLVVFEKAVLSSNEKLYEFISPFINWNEDEEEIKNFILSMVIKHGARLSKTIFATKIKSLVNSQDIIKFFPVNKNYFMDKEIANNIDTFFEMDILYHLVNEEEMNKNMKFYSFKKNKEEFKNIIKKIDKTKDYSFIIKDFLGEKFNNLSLNEKIKFLNKEGLLTDSIWEKIIVKENIALLNLMFKETDSINFYFGEKRITQLVSEYKKGLLEIACDKDLIREFIEKYPPFLEKDELIKLISKRYGYLLESGLEDENIYLYKEEQKEINFVKILFEKYPTYMNDENNIWEIINHTRHDIFLKHYIIKLSEELNENQWNKLINKKDKKLLKILFNYKDSFTILTDSHKEKISKEYKNILLESFVDIDDVINFIEKYSYELEKKEVLNIIGKANKYAKLLSETEKEATNLVKQKYFDQLNINQLSSYEYYTSHYLKKEKKLIDMCFDKYHNYLNDSESLLSLVKVSDNDIFISTYLKKYFEINTNEELKKLVVKNLTIFDSNFFGNTLEWVIDNNLLNELFPKNDSVVADKILLTNQSWNIWIPLLVEKFGINPDGLIKQTVTSFVSNDQLFKFILNNYELNSKTEQIICNSVFAIDSVELAEELFKKGITPNDYYAEKFKMSPTNAGNVLLKAKLKEKLQKKFEAIEEEIKIKKIKKI